VSQDEPPLPTAYCAPGRQFTAALTLALKGERVAEIREHPWLEGSADVLVVNTAEIEHVDWPVVFGPGPERPPLFDRLLLSRCSPPGMLGLIL
jgi:hypothetical protein